MTRQDRPRRVTVLLLMPAEAELVREAVERFQATNGGGHKRLRSNVLELLERSRYTDHELRQLAELEHER